MPFDGAGIYMCLVCHHGVVRPRAGQLTRRCLAAILLIPFHAGITPAVAVDDSMTSKRDRLTETGTLNPGPVTVVDPKFHEGEFFDPRDVVQVKYEMLRRVLVDDVPVGEAAAEYGFSRPTYYQAKAKFEAAGLAGLVPKKRGPRGPHKLRGDVLELIRRAHVPGGPIRARELAARVREELGVEVHPRSIERALGKSRVP